MLANFVTEDRALLIHAKVDMNRATIVDGITPPLNNSQLRPQSCCLSQKFKLTIWYGLIAQKVDRQLLLG